MKNAPTSRLFGLRLMRALCLAPILWCQAANAQTEPFDYRLGAVKVLEDAQSLRFDTERATTVNIEGGGHLLPPVSLDEQGRIYIGPDVFDSSNGRRLRTVERKGRISLALPFDTSVSVTASGYRIRRGKSVCDISARALGIAPDRTAARALEYGTVVFGASRQTVVAMVTQLYEDIRDTTYLAGPIDMAACTFRPARLGNPDLLVELGTSERGGWWITGSIEQTLLRSANGRKWREVALPAELSSLISSYIVDDREIWLAAILDIQDDLDPLLVRSTDGGLSWRAVGANDPLLEQVPTAWLEGQRRIGSLRWAKNRKAESVDMPGKPQPDRE